MKNHFIVFILTILSLPFITNGQCEVVSSNGYTVHIALNATKVNTSSTNCQYGYNYTVDIQYDISFSGTNIPNNLYTLQGTLSCASNNSFFDLPNNGGTGITNTANAYSSLSNCKTVTPESLSCYSVNLQIAGPGLSTSTTCTFTQALPVELINFQANWLNENEVKLAWQTTSELNNDLFQIERSDNGIDWETISDVNGNGHSEELIAYNFIDYTPLRTGISYYRLKQIDVDGKFSYSNIASVTSKEKQYPNLFVYPNPAKNTLTIEGMTNWPNQVQLYSIEGRLVQEFPLDLNLEKKQINVQEIKLGTYLLYLGNKAVKFIKL